MNTTEKTPMQSYSDKIVRGGKTLFVEYGVNNCAPGKQPYSFSITAVLINSTKYDTPKAAPDHLWDCCGCLHEEIEKWAPGKYSDLIAFHLRHEDGTPMYAIENGFYYAQIFKGTAKYSKDAPEKGLKCFADHMQIKEATARIYLAEIFSHEHEHAQKLHFATLIERHRAEWKAEARRLKTKYSLKDAEIFD